MEYTVLFEKFIAEKESYKLDSLKLLINNEFIELKDKRLFCEKLVSILEDFNCKPLTNFKSKNIEHALLYTKEPIQ